MNESVDVLVIGAGINGAGVAQAAAAQGLRTTLLEQYAEPAQGTSSRSSKLIHGGLRYLELGEIGLVRESLRERALLLRNAPGLVQLIPFHIPVYEESSRGPLTVRAGLTLYRALGGLRSDTRFRLIEKTVWADLDGLKQDGLQAVFRYYDAQTDDVLLTRAVLRSAVDQGARIQFGARVERIELIDQGCRVCYRYDEERHTLHARAVVNATGPWINSLLECVEPAQPRQAVELVKGTHLVLERTLNHGAYYVESPIDRRGVFVLPWGDKTLLGTTERLHTGAPEAAAPATDEVEYLLDTYRYYFSANPPRVTKRFAGLRVLPGGKGALHTRSRESLLIPDCAEQPRLVTIVGGKLTVYRATAMRVMGLLRSALPAPRQQVDTADLALGTPDQESELRLT